MARSYTKFILGYWEYTPSITGSIRAKERCCIHAEMKAPVNGEVVFPKYYHNEWKSSAKTAKYIRSRITKKYTKEISEILNGVGSYGWRGFGRYDFCFLEDVQLIKKDKIPHFDWLNHKEIKKVIKTWDNGIFDVLYYLSQHGYIKKAVKNEQKKLFRK